MPQRLITTCGSCRSIAREYGFGPEHRSLTRRCNAPARDGICGGRVTVRTNGFGLWDAHSNPRIARDKWQDPA